jgi:hypothetical protein
LLVDGTLDECIRQFEIHTAPQPPLVGAVLSEEHIVEARAAAGFSLIWICPARSRLSALPVRLSRARIHWCRRSGGIQHSLKNYNGKGVQNVAVGKPAKWKLKKASTERRLASKAEFNGGWELQTYIRIVPGRPRHTLQVRRPQLSPCAGAVSLPCGITMATRPREPDYAEGV